MGLWKKITRVFSRDDRFDNKRTFKELTRTAEMDEALRIKEKLERADIPVYILDLRNIGKSQSYIALRVPGKHMQQAKNILQTNE